MFYSCFSKSGHGETNYPGAKPIMKSVVVHNAGDVQVEFGGAYFSDAVFGESTFRRAEPMNEQRLKMLASWGQLRVRWCKSQLDCLGVGTVTTQ